MPLPPGPRRPAVLQTLAWIRRPAPFLDECARRYGRRFTLRFVRGRNFVLVSDPAHVKAVFTGPPDVFLSGRANQSFRAFLGDHSLFVLDGAEHRRHRRLLLPPFRGERMRAYGDLIRDLTCRRLETWREGAPFRAIDEFHAITLHVIFQAIFGLRDEARGREMARLVALLAGRAPALLTFLPALQRDLGPWSPWGRFLRARRAVYDILDDEIAQARGAVGEGAGREDILAKLIEESAKEGDPFTDEELRAELLTLLGAGHETTTAGLAWALQWILGTDPVRERVLEEVRGTVGAGPLEGAHLPKLRVLEAAIQESLRLSPPIPIALRFLARDAEVGGLALPAGTIVCPCAYLTQRDPAIFPDPLRFDPARFLGERRPGPFEFYPFGGGNRLCVGLAFAIFEMKVVLASILARADLALVEPASARGKRKGIILAPANGTRVVLRRRVG
jgi:cytochrome P450